VLQVESKAHVLKRRRENQHEFLYTLPVTPKAGEKLELFYNPDLTPLRGRPEIYVRGGFNRCGLCAAATYVLLLHVAVITYNII
jgi:starch synthase